MAPVKNEHQGERDDVTHAVAEALALSTDAMVCAAVEVLEGLSWEERARVEAEVDAAWAERERQLSA